MDFRVIDMNKYKVGDRVWYRGHKLTVVNCEDIGYWIFKKQFLELSNGIGIAMVTTSLCVDLKPIITVQA